VQYDFEMGAGSPGTCMYGEVSSGAAREMGEEQVCKIMIKKRPREDDDD